MKSLILLAALSLSLLNIVQAQTPVRLKQVVAKRFDIASNGLVTWDSTVFHYSGNRKGYLENEHFFEAFGNDQSGTPGVPWIKFASNPTAPHLLPVDELQYDSLVRYQCHLVPSPMAHYRNKQEISNGHVTKYTNEEYVPATNKWEIRRINQFTYQNNLLKSRRYGAGGGWTDTVGYHYVVNSNNLVDSLTLTYNSGNIIVYTYSYNSSNQVSEVNSFHTQPRLDKTVFGYNAGGLVTNSTTLTYDFQNSAWDTLNAFDYSYNTGNRVIRQEYREINAQGLELLYAIDISYDNDNNRVEDVIHFDFYKHGLNTGLVKVARKQYGYNSFGLISDYEVTHWNDSSQAWELGADSLFGPSQKVTLEYEAHWPQDVSTINTMKSGVTIFPSPASDFITAQAEEMPAGKLEAVIYDMHGRLLRRWADESNGVYLRTIPVQELPAGNYILQLNGKETNRSEKFVIYR
ncbi:MAG: T9SS type A sorting domain-containing protein [Taibaiella sp.]|nr:T9SS type A sorting domain-containing protein [Taibaiella sp.]